ncbi:hypothetical protein [Streptomyces sp. MNP-20]|nr:hypothetical protein [Streptomyces sp. MNP-20]
MARAWQTLNVHAEHSGCALGGFDGFWKVARIDDGYPDGSDNPA